jgi:hypothetical protein
MSQLNVCPFINIWVLLLQPVRVNLSKAGKDELFKKSLKPCFKLQRCLSSSNPSLSTLLHLYDHTIKPILVYGSEIWGMFSTESVTCKKNNNFILEKVFMDDITEKSHIRFMKYIIGVNKKASNIAVMSELGRFPMYFSVIISMKLFLNNTINPVPSYFYAGSRIGQILHTRIRTESSALKDHLYKKNIEANPYCSCKLVETSEHFLLKCSL